MTIAQHITQFAKNSYGALQVGLGNAMIKMAPTINAMYGPGYNLTRAHDGASYDRTSRYWYPSHQSPDAENYYDQPTLRDRSRDLHRNNAIGRGAINVVVTNVIGRGLSCQPSIDAEFLGLSDEAAEEWQANTQRLYEQYEKDCDASSRFCMTQIQRLAYLSTKTSGEVFAALPIIKRAGSPWLTRIQLIESDLVYNPSGAINNATMRNGIVVDEYERPVAYSVYNWDGKSKIIPARGGRSGRRNILHIFKPERPGQSRGVPFLSPVIKVIKQLGNYKESEITAAVVSSLFTVFIKSDRPEALDSPFTPSAMYAEPINDAQKVENDYVLAPGAINRLDKDEDITFANPTRPNSGYEEFVKALLKEVGMALEIPYEILVKQFEASYSASRGAKLEFWKMVMAEREDFIDGFCQPIYEEWLAEQVMLGRINAPGFFTDPFMRAEWVKARWVGESMGQLDEVKEIQAAQMRVASRFSTFAAETANMNGMNWAKNARTVSSELSEMGYSSTPVNIIQADYLSPFVNATTKQSFNPVSSTSQFGSSGDPEEGDVEDSDEENGNEAIPPEDTEEDTDETT